MNRWILTACMVLTAVSMTAALSATQDEVLLTTVMSNEPLLIARGEVTLSNGKAIADLSSSFCGCLDSTKQAQCFVTSSDGSAASGLIDVSTGKVTVTGKGSGKVSWLVIGTPKASGHNHK